MARLPKQPLSDLPDQDLGELEAAFDEALEFVRNDRHDAAKATLRTIIEAEPRLPEPYLELAVLVHAEGDVDNAIACARLGIEYLEKGGQWIDNLPEAVLLAHARNVLGELLVEAAQQDEALADAERFGALTAEAAELFRLAHEGDPANERARTNAIHFRATSRDE